MSTTTFPGDKEALPPPAREAEDDKPPPPFRQNAFLLGLSQTVRLVAVSLDTFLQVQKLEQTHEVTTSLERSVFESDFHM